MNMPDLQRRVTYVLPIRSAHPRSDGDFCDYLRRISAIAETIVVDGSESPVFEEHARSWGSMVIHVRPRADLVTPMGKVGGALTGIRLASYDKIIIADDDIRYDEAGVVAIENALDHAEVVRPQNYFSPTPWHALWDSGRILLNRISGGDWPGTLGVLREPLLEAGGYDGTVMFENLELVRTIVASGGREEVLLDTYVARRPSTTRHFFSQRVRQAYDEFSRLPRLAFQLSWLPAVIIAFRLGGWKALAFAAVIIMALAEAGRRRGDANRVFPFAASLVSPAWVLERAICAWLAVGARITFGGIPYRGTILSRAATPMAVLRARLASRKPALPENFDLDRLERSVVG